MTGMLRQNGHDLLLLIVLFSFLRVDPTHEPWGMPKGGLCLTAPTALVGHQAVWVRQGRRKGQVCGWCLGVCASHLIIMLTPLHIPPPPPSRVRRQVVGG